MADHAKLSQVNLIVIFEVYTLQYVLITRLLTMCTLVSNDRCFGGTKFQ
jgi:hypothetical protein